MYYQDIPAQQQTVMVVNQIDNNNYQRPHKYTVYYQDIPTQQHTVMVVNHIQAYEKFWAPIYIILN